MASENLVFLDELGTQQLAEAILSKTNERIAERIVQEVNDASDHDHVPSALLLNALLKVRDQQISSNKTSIDSNKALIDGIKESVTTLEGNVTANTTGITSATEEITKLSDKVDAFTHLTTDIVIGAITDVQNPSTEILYLQKDDESATIWSLWIYRSDNVWIRIGDTAIDLSGYWKKTDIDSIKVSIEVPDVDPLVEAKIKAAVETAFTNTDPLNPPIPPGPPTDFTITNKNRAMVGYTGEENEELVIPETFIGSDGISYKVVAVGDGAFAGCRNLTSVSIPNSTTSIGIRSFMSCSSLKSVIIPEGVTSIGDSAFYQCGSLESIIIPSTVDIIDRGAFVDCTSLSTVTLPNTITTISNEVFVRCAALTSITIPDTVTSIGRSAFASTGLISIDIPNSVNSIDAEALGGCKSLTEINVDHIENAITGSPWGATNATVNWLRTVKPTTQDFIVTSGNRSKIGYKGTADEILDIPESFSENEVQYNVVGIGMDAFFNCKTLKSVKVPSTVTSIGDGAFTYCKGLETVELLPGLVSIGIGAFTSCDKITTINIPNSVTTIARTAFDGCTSLTTINVDNTVDSIQYASWSAPSTTKVNWLRTPPPSNN